MLSSSVASNVTYNVSRNSHRETHSSNSMVDNGANGGIAGGNTRKVCETGRYVDVTGVDNHELNNLAICTRGRNGRSSWKIFSMLFSSVRISFGW